MDTASLEFCEELYTLSRWETPRGQWTMIPAHDIDKSDTFGQFKEIPQYSFGYLIRKLPPNVTVEKLSGLDEDGEDKEYYTAYRLVAEEHHGGTALECGTEWLRENEHHANTPEDVLAKLAIELFKHGLLKR